jgi:putative FmdB family regulatory protein
MPIYAYRCGACGHARDILQKLSDPLLTQCPACGADTFAKQVTAAGFQLKGSGWYVTDFRDGGKGKPKSDAEGGTSEAKADTGESNAAADKSDAKSSDAKSSEGASTAAKGTDAKPAAASPSAGASPSPAPSPAPPAAGATGSSSSTR